MKKETKKRNVKKKTTNKNMSRVETKYGKKKVKKRKILFGRILFVFVLFFFILYMIMHFVSFPIRNIYVKGNTILSDQEIIELASLENYPSYFTYTKSKIESTLEKNTYIKKATVKKRRLKEIMIEIEENTPLFYDESREKTVLKDKTMVDTKFNTPILLNYIPDTLYSEFTTNIIKLDTSIMNRISEIKYDPNDVDEKRFLLSMNDGNYVYVTLNKMDKINHYVEIMKEVLSKYDEKKGILFLDEGEYFEVFKD